MAGHRAPLPGEDRMAKPKDQPPKESKSVRATKAKTKALDEFVVEIGLKTQAEVEEIQKTDPWNK
jgi:hypothetical protein